MHTAGLHVVVPSTPADAYSLLRDSIESDDPVIYLEPKRRYWAARDFERGARTEPIGKAAVRRAGTTVTVVTYGGLVGTALEAAAWPRPTTAGRWRSLTFAAWCRWTSTPSPRRWSRPVAAS